MADVLADALDDDVWYSDQTEVVSERPDATPNDGSVQYQPEAGSQTEDTMPEDSLVLYVLADVKLELSIPSVQDETFTVVGPVEVVRLLADTVKHDVSLSKGVLSPRCAITLRQAARATAGVPEAAVSFAFAYPHFGDQSVFSRLIGHAAQEPWLFFLLLGGFCYFDGAGVLLQVNALTLNKSTQSLHLVGPHEAAPAACEWLRERGRLHPITLPSLQESGFRSFGWVHPCETANGVMLGQDDVRYPDGAFVYELSEGCIFYELASGSVQHGVPAHEQCMRMCEQRMRVEHVCARRNALLTPLFAAQPGARSRRSEASHTSRPTPVHVRTKGCGASLAACTPVHGRSSRPPLPSSTCGVGPSAARSTQRRWDPPRGPPSSSAHVTAGLHSWCSLAWRRRSCCSRSGGPLAFVFFVLAVIVLLFAVVFHVPMGYLSEVPCRSRCRWWRSHWCGMP